MTTTAAILVSKKIHRLIFPATCIQHLREMTFLGLEPTFSITPNYILLFFQFEFYLPSQRTTQFKVH